MKYKKSELWDLVSKTNPDNTRAVSYGRKFTAIDAYSQILEATKLWGPYGSSWGLTNIRYQQMCDGKLMHIIAGFIYPEGHFELSTAVNIISSKGIIDDDFSKKGETDLLTKALSRIGFNADVFLGKFDDSKYVKLMKEEFIEKNKTKENTELEKAKKDFSPNIFAIKKAISNKEYEIVFELWSEIDEAVQKLLWVPEKELGPFSNKERMFIKESKDKNSSQDS